MYGQIERTVYAVLIQQFRLRNRSWEPEVLGRRASSGEFLKEPKLFRLAY